MCLMGSTSHSCALHTQESAEGREREREKRRRALHTGTSTGGIVQILHTPLTWMRFREIDRETVSGNINIMPAASKQAE